mmetsp:Transcript_11709/g.38526  ORF Transcript_11709/g.38526 Transcript_11709/m.38526 type:complete len:324 (-) Transcript_11709:503-1474(-)
MGRRKKFQGTTFRVLHRSLGDGAQGVDEAPSAFVLYDYDRHLREIGGGTFVTADGKVMPSAALPMASTELDGEEANPDDMDADLREALFNGDSVEELQDDFVKAAQGEAPKNFDYDAHVARLLLKDEAFDAALEDFDDDASEDDEEGHLAFDSEFFQAMLGGDEEDRRSSSSSAAEEDEAAVVKARTLERAAELNDDDDDVDAGLAAEEEALAEARRRREDALDCESVLSTLSNVDNRPNLLPSSQKKKKKAPSPLPEDEEDHLSEEEATTTTAQGGGSKQERKAAVKAERRVARQRKKASKVAWRAQPTSQGACPSVIRLSS